MGETTPTKITLAVLALAFAALGAAAAHSLHLLVKQPAALTPAQCVSREELSQKEEGLKARLREAGEELNALRVQTDEIYQSVEQMKGDSSLDMALRKSLPPPYLEQIDSFFSTAAARNLLMPEVQNAPGLRFGLPSFLDLNTISVPYRVGGKNHYMLVEVKSLDLYNLRFDVIWDSMESGRQ